MESKNHRIPVLSPLDMAAGLTDFWSPRVIAELDDSYVKVAKLKGSLAWHSHEDEDELFIILQGDLIIEYESSQVDLKTGLAKTVEYYREFISQSGK